MLFENIHDCYQILDTEPQFIFAGYAANILHSVYSTSHHIRSKARLNSCAENNIPPFNLLNINAFLNLYFRNLK